MNVSVSKNVLNVTIGETSLKLLTSAVVNVGGGDADTLQGEDGAYYLDRSNHTGTQAIGTIDGLQAALDNKIEGVAWGDITGTLSDQTDLQAALDLKLDAADYNDRFLGLYASLFDLQAAHPTAAAGDYAQVDLGIGTDVIVYTWDVNDAKWAAVGSSPIANTDALPEGSTNLYHTSQRVRDVTLTGFTASNTPITSTDSIVQAFGKAQGQLNTALNENQRTLVYKNPTINKVITSSVTASAFSVDKSVFGGGVPVDLVLYSAYIVEIDLILDFPSAQAGNVGVIAFINNLTMPLSSEMLMPVASVNFASVYRARLILCRVSGDRLSVSGLGEGLNGAIINYTHSTATYVNPSSISFDVGVRFTTAPSGANKIILKSARLYKFNT